MKFDVERVTKDLISWIRVWFMNNGNGCNAVLGISGGKDSTVAAKLCVEALGPNRVIGVLIPNGVQRDIDDSIRVCELLGIKYYVINIKDSFASIIGQINENCTVSEQTYVNLAPRLRMSVLYAVSQSNNGRVVNTCNLSETYVGYETKGGDAMGDFSPLGSLLVGEILEIGEYLGLPSSLVHKTPMDGLNLNADGSYVSDEQVLGVTYNNIDRYINGELPHTHESVKVIEEKHRRAVLKSKMDVFEYKRNK